MENQLHHSEGLSKGPKDLKSGSYILPGIKGLTDLNFCPDFFVM